MTITCWFWLGCGEQLGRQAEPVLQVGERVAHVPARFGQVAQLQLDGARDRSRRSRSSRAGNWRGSGSPSRAPPSWRRRSAPPTSSTSSCRAAARSSCVVVRSVSWTWKSSGSMRSGVPSSREQARCLSVAHQVELERVAVGVRPRLLRAAARDAAVIGLVAAGCGRAAGPGRCRAAPAGRSCGRRLRRERRAALALRQVAGVREQAKTFWSSSKLRAASVAEELAQRVGVDRRRAVRRGAASSSCLQALHLAHEVDAPPRSERPRGPSEAGRRSGAGSPRGRLMSSSSSSRSSKARRASSLSNGYSRERARAPPRGACGSWSSCARFARVALVVAGLIERVALLVEDVLEALAQLGERIAQVDVLHALAHRLAQLLEEARRGRRTRMPSQSSPWCSSQSRACWTSSV